MQKQSFFLLATLVTGVVAAGLYLAPSHQEMALMQMNDAGYHEAFDRYTKLQEKGDNSINVLVPLIRLHLHYGEPDKAIALLERYIADHPRSLDAHKQLAALYKATERLYLYAGELETLQKLSPSLDNLQEMAGTYDFLGEYKNEMGALAKLVAWPDYAPQEDDYARLASFYRVNGQPAEASQTMVDLMQARNYRVTIDAVLLADQLLLDNGELREAAAISARYLEGNKKDAVTLASMFYDAREYKEASALLAPYLGDMDRSPAMLAMVAGLQMAQGQDRQAYTLLSQRFVQGTLPQTLAGDLVDLAVKYNNYALVEQLLGRMALDTLPQEALVRYVDVAFQTHRPDLARLMQQRLGKEYLKQAPLLAVMLAAAQNAPGAEGALLAYPSDTIQQPEAKLLMAGMFSRYGHPARARALFEDMPVANMLGALDGFQIAELYLNTGDAAKAVQRLSTLPAGSTPALRAKADRALFLLAAGAGDAGTVRQWLAAHSPGKDLLDDAYTLAQRHHQDAMVLLMADQMFRQDRTPANRMQLAEALLTNHRYAEALSTMRPLTAGSPTVRERYFEAMADWMRQAAKTGLTPTDRAELTSFINSAAPSAGMSADEKRSMAYLFNEAGFTGKAQALYLALAGDQPYGSPDVQELLGFWGPHLSPAALSWIEARAENTVGEEKAQWLGYLNATGNPQVTIALLQGTQNLSPSMADVYIDALQVTHNKKLGHVLAQEMDREIHPQRLARLATVADEENLTGVAETGWHRLYALDPQNAEAAKHMGLLAFAQSHYTEAKKYLDQYRQAKGGKVDDYRVNYAYAEILQHKDKKSEARRYYAEAVQQVSEIKQTDLGSQLDKAHLLYRNNHIEEALGLYRQLLAQHPANKTLRADFAEILMDAKKYAEASAVLSAQ